MDAARRLSLPLVVMGVGLVICGVRTGHSPSADPATLALAYAPPAMTGTAVAADAVHVTTGVKARTPVVNRQRKPARNAAPARAAVAPTPRSASTPAPKPASPAGRPARPSTARASGPTSWSALNAAITRIPTYRAGAARWVLSSKYDFWGTADWYHDVLYVDPDVPVDKLYDVAVHEWSHELSVLDYRGDVLAATRAMNATFGGRGLTGPERAADCMSILQGASWTHYTTCTHATWRAAAARLLAGKTLR